MMAEVCEAIAGIAKAVAVGILLSRVRDLRTIVTIISSAVRIGVGELKCR